MLAIGAFSLKRIFVFESSPIVPSATPSATNSSPAAIPAKTPQEPIGEAREIEVTAQQFEFIPNPIRVKVGENIRLKITSVDVDHGFSLPEFGINEILSPGGTITVEFQATEIGEFEFSCSVFCGSGHSNMRGKLIVE